MIHLSDDEIQSYVLGLDEGSGRRVERHLAQCHHCQDRMRVHELIDDVIESALSQEIPEGFETAVMNRLTAQNRALRSADLLVTAAGAMGFGLIALAFLLSAGLRDALVDVFSAMWGELSMVIADIGPGPEAMATVIFSVVVLVFFVLLDRLTGRRLFPVTGRRTSAGAP